MVTSANNPYDQNYKLRVVRRFGSAFALLLAFGFGLGRAAAPLLVPLPLPIALLRPLPLPRSALGAFSRRRPLNMGHDSFRMSTCAAKSRALIASLLGLVPGLA